MPTQPVHVSYCVPLQVLTKSGQRLMGPNITDVAHYLGTNMSAHPQGSYLHSQGQNHLCPERTYMTQNDSLLEFIYLVYFSLIFFLFCISLSRVRPLGRLQDWGTIQSFQNLMNSKSAHMGFSNLCVLISDGRFGESGSSQHLKVQISNHKTKGKPEFPVQGNDVMWMLAWELCTNTQQGCSIVSLLGWKYPDYNPCWTILTCNSGATAQLWGWNPGRQDIYQAGSYIRRHVVFLESLTHTCATDCQYANCLKTPFRLV